MLKWDWLLACSVSHAANGHPRLSNSVVMLNSVSMPLRSLGWQEKHGCEGKQHDMQIVVLVIATGTQSPTQELISPHNLFCLREVDISQGNPISLVKTFATKNCAMCAKERIAILKQSRSNAQLPINANNEICGVCGHRPCFHRHANQTTPNTDESINDKRVSPTHEVTTDFTRCNVCLADV